MSPEKKGDPPVQPASRTPSSRPDSAVDNAIIEDAVRVANIPTLVMVLVQLTGELRWLESPYTIARTKGMADNDTGGLPVDRQEEVRAAASSAIVAWREGARVAVPDPSPELLTRMLAASMGEAVPDEYGSLIAHELNHGAGETVVSSLDPPPGFRALIIGAGVSGIAAAVRMASLGIDCTVLEKSDDLGGVWLDNTYPGAGVDTPSHLYSYSFAPHDWTRYFASRDEIHRYLNTVVDDFDVRSRIRFGVEVLSAEYDSARHMWNVSTRAAGGSTSNETASVVLSCVGAFNPPLTPQLPGLDSFQGRSFHTAEWPSDLVLAGKKVAVVGNGASAMQVVPAIAESVDQIAVFQRSPQWVQPFEKFQKDVPEPMRLLFREVPLFRAWYRLRLSWIFHDKLYGALQRDPEWAGSANAINRTNDGHRKYLTAYIESQIGERPDLLEKVVPSYPPFGKRMLQDNGWFRTLTLPNVHLVTDSIKEVRARSVVTDAGEDVEADVLAFATGFDVVRFLSSVEVVGRDGRLLRDVWDGDDGRAYLGLTVPGFPNFFTLYGPNTQTGHGGSLIHTVEAQLDYLESLFRQMFAGGIATVECREDVYENYSTTVDEMHENMIWTHPAMDTYYRNSRGRVVVINPFRNVDFFHMTREAQLDDFHTVDVDEAAA